MPESDETQRFDALLDAMLTKPGRDEKAGEPEGEEDLREPEIDQ